MAIQESDNDSTGEQSGEEEEEESLYVESQQIEWFPRDGVDEENTVPEIRGAIAVEIGGRTNVDSALDIRTLNNCYRALRGEFHTTPKFLGTPLSPGPGRIRLAIANVCMGLGYDGMETYVPTPEELSEGERWEDRAFWKSELLTLWRALSEEEDKRPTPPDPREGGDGE